MNNEMHAAGFDPRKLMKETVNGAGETVRTLELRHKKTWFRLACPNGGLVLAPLRVTDQMAIFEARLFADKDDRTPMASFTATRAAGKGGGGQYIRAAQDEALDEVLNNAGFGPEFCGLTLAEGLPRPRSAPEKQTDTAPAAKTGEPVPPAPPADTPKRAAQPQAVEQEEPAAAQAVGQSVEVVKTADTPLAPPVEASKQTAPPVQAAAADKRPAPVAPQPHGPAVNTAAGQKSAPLPVVDIAAHQSAAAEPAANPKPEPVPQGEPAGQEAIQAAASLAPFTADMTVEQICPLMTMEQARAIQAPSGIRKGWTLGQVTDEAPASLKWYRHICPDADNITKAACQLLLDHLTQKETLKQAG